MLLQEFAIIFLRIISIFPLLLFATLIMGKRSNRDIPNHRKVREYLMNSKRNTQHSNNKKCNEC